MFFENSNTATFWPRWDFLWCATFTILVYIVYTHLQPTYTYALLDPRYDAHKYAQLYNYFSRLSPNSQVSFPFNSRILMPWLAAQIPFHDLILDFIWLNCIFILLTIGVLVFIWQKLQIRLSVIVIGLFWVLFHWKGLVRMYLPDPVTADVGGYFFQSLWLGLISIFLFSGEKTFFKWYHLFLACMVGLLGTLQKESFLCVVGLTMFSFRKVDRGHVMIIVFVLALSIYILVANEFPASTSDWRNNTFISVLRGLKRYASQPELFLRLPISWLLAFGTFWLVVIGEWKTEKGKWGKEKGTRDSELFTQNSLLTTRYWELFTLLWLFLSIFGGGDTTRILFNGMPFVLTFLLLKLNQKPDWVVWYILFTSLPLMRLFELEPDLGLYPQATQRWCVECWTFSESWGYWLYFVVVLVGYYYLSRRLRFSGRQANEVNARR